MSGTHDTKQAIASALIELCEQKDFRKISVQDITKKVGLNRQTFYYHFTDKYDLLRWIYRHDALIYLETDICLENWEEQALKLLKAIKEKSHFYYTTVTSDSESKFPVGSSAKIICGLLTKARAIHTRCFWPPDKLFALF